MLRALALIEISVGTFGSQRAKGFWSMSNREYVVLLGDFSTERLDFSAIVREFKWSVAKASDISELAPIRASGRIVAVVIQTGTLDMSWRKALRTVRAEIPNARIILCHKPSQSDARAEMVEAGAFGAILLPLARVEVRQVLGFIWASESMPLEPAPAKKIRAINASARRAGAA